jgi:hypothetical protein
MCPSGVTCLPTDCCFSEQALKIQVNMLILYKTDIIINSGHDIAEQFLMWH